MRKNSPTTTFMFQNDLLLFDNLILGKQCLSSIIMKIFYFEVHYKLVDFSFAGALVFVGVHNAWDF